MVGANEAGAIKSDGTLWKWGNSSWSPAQILDNVVDVCMVMGVSAAIKTDGSLWNWGEGSAILTRKESGSEPVNITD